MILGFKVLRVEDWVNTDADSFDSKKQNALKRQQDWKRLIMWSHCPGESRSENSYCFDTGWCFCNLNWIYHQGKG